ncbi:MAG: Ig-like domain-containing protein [Acidimicrobiales bacterium]
MRFSSLPAEGTALSNGRGPVTGTTTAAVPAAGVAGEIASSANPSAYGEPVVFTAHVTSSVGRPTGRVRFADADAPFGSASLDHAGRAGASTNGLAVGEHTVVASYEGDGDFAPSSAAVVQLVRRAMTTTVVTCAESPTSFGEVATMVARVRSVAPGVPTGVVAFSADGVPVATGALDGAGRASVPLDELRIGRHVITAAYRGDHSFGPSSGEDTHVVRAPTTIVLRSSADPNPFGQPVELTALVGSPLGGSPTGEVAFEAGGLALGSISLDEGGQAHLTVSTLGGGSHRVVATYGGDANSGPASTALVQRVEPAPTTISLSTGGPSGHGDDGVADDGPPAARQLDVDDRPAR